MPRKSALSEKGRRFLRGGRMDVRKRDYRRPIKQSRGQYPLWNGQLLNQWESIVAWALTDLHINFEPQAVLGSVRVLGGALVDFLLPEYKIALEVQGPFHSTTEGQVRDFWRTANRAYYGYRVVEVTENDLDEIYVALRRLVGWSAWSVGD